MNPEEIYKNTLLKFDLQTFLKNNTGKNSLQLKKKYPELYKLLSVQLEIYPKAKDKLPVFTSEFCFLTSKSFEQSSSETLANYKASLFNGNLLIDLTGGLGIDDIAFSASFKKILSIDIDKELNLLTEVNLKKLGIGNITRITSKAEDFIKQDISADLIYADADRRNRTSGKKAVTFHDSSPNIPVITDRLFKISPIVLLKLSPLADITYIKKTLPNVKIIRVVSLNTEVKEILVLLDKTFTSDPEVIAADISANGRIFQFSSNYHITGKSSGNHDQKYFFVPASCLVKAGLVGMYADFAGITPVAEGSIYHFSKNLPIDFLGRIFSIQNKMPFGKSSFRKYLLDNNISKANISAGKFPVKPEEIKKIFNLSDGGNEYFFFTKIGNLDKLVYHCRKI